MRLGSPGQNALEGFWVGPETRTREQLGEELPASKGGSQGSSQTSVCPQAP